MSYIIPASFPAFFPLQEIQIISYILFTPNSQYHFQTVEIGKYSFKETHLKISQANQIEL